MIHTVHHANECKLIREIILEDHPMQPCFRIQKHFPESKTLGRIPGGKHFPEKFCVSVNKEEFTHFGAGWQKGTFKCSITKKLVLHTEEICPPCFKTAKEKYQHSKILRRKGMLKQTELQRPKTCGARAIRKKKGAEMVKVP